jgi:hypothetical protein
MPDTCVTVLPSNAAVTTVLAGGPEVVRPMLTVPFIEEEMLADVMWFVEETCSSQTVCQMPEFRV